MDSNQRQRHRQQKGETKPASQTTPPISGRLFRTPGTRKRGPYESCIRQPEPAPHEYQYRPTREECRARAALQVDNCILSTVELQGYGQGSVEAPVRADPSRDIGHAREPRRCHALGLTVDNMPDVIYCKAASPAQRGRNRIPVWYALACAVWGYGLRSMCASDRTRAEAPRFNLAPVTTETAKPGRAVPLRRLADLRRALCRLPSPPFYPESRGTSKGKPQADSPPQMDRSI